MKYEIVVELVPAKAGCQGCLFENEDICPCDDCGNSNIFRLVECEAYNE